MALADAAGSGNHILCDRFVIAETAGEVLALPDVNGVLICGANLLAADSDAVLRCIPERLLAPA